VHFVLGQLRNEWRRLNNNNNNNNNNCLYCIEILTAVKYSGMKHMEHLSRGVEKKKCQQNFQPVGKVTCEQLLT
jgi:hypothetical protein